MEFKDYYAALGVPRDAPQEAIKKAYRQLARKYHPDVSQEADAEARMREVNEAYAVLSDPERRAAYDQLGRNGPRAGEPFHPPPGWDAGFEFGSAPGDGVDPAAADYSEFFAELFGHLRRRQGGRRAAAGMRGEDHHAKVMLELEDAWRGATRRLALKMPELDAQGRLHLRERVLEVKIPVGVRPGQLIRLAGQGGAGGAQPGDLLLEVQFAPHPRFRLDGRNLVADLPLAPWEAALGAVVPVQLPGGRSLKVRVPAAAQGGQRLSVRGQGLPGQPPGDLELKLRVLLPSAMDPRARRLYEEMAAALPDFDARQQAAAMSGEAAT